MTAKVGTCMPQEQQPVVIPVEILVPAGAELWIQGVKMQETGMNRPFETPPLRPGQDYTYTLKVVHQGKEVTREVTLRSGAAELLRLP